MIGVDEMREPDAATLCKSCGLCCNGHLFIWVKLKPSELDPIEALGVQVFRSQPNERGFNQPCPLWNGKCTIYETVNYPRACRAYQCKLLKEVIGETTSLPDALALIQQVKDMIRAVADLLPVSSNPNFRERMVALIEHPSDVEMMAASYPRFREKAHELLRFYASYFGVNDLLE